MYDHGRHIELIEAVNNARTHGEHAAGEMYLAGWREGVEMGTERKLDYTVCDLYYLNQGIDRPMCCGVWLDWKPSEGGQDD